MMSPLDADFDEPFEKHSVSPNPFSPFADADPALRHLLPVPAFLPGAPAPGTLSFTGCGRLAAVPADPVEIDPAAQLPDGVCPRCTAALRAGAPQWDNRPAAACRACGTPTLHDALCALCRQDLHAAWQAEQGGAR